MTVRCACAGGRGGGAYNASSVAGRTRRELDTAHGNLRQTAQVRGQGTRKSADGEDRRGFAPYQFKRR